MSRVRRRGVIGPLLLAAVAAEAGARLLAPRDAAPPPADVDLNAYFSEAEIERGARFARPQRALALVRAGVDLAALVGVTWLLGGAERRCLPPRVTNPFRRPVLDGAVTGAGLAVVLALPPLPIAAIARRRAIEVGLVTQSWPGWAADLVKSTTIGAAFAGAAGAGAVWVTRRFPRTWWLPTAAGSVLVGGALAALAPVVLDPLFNEFTPLPEGETRSDVLALAQAAGVKVGEIYSVDASRRTTAANAYVTGLGPTKRVVLFDTLLDRYSLDEIRVVVAHELAHVRYRDVPRGVAYAAVVAPATALAVQRVSWLLSSERGTPAALPALALASALVTAPIGLIVNRVSRALERRADHYSLELSGAPDAFISFERAIAVQNVADLKPPRWLTSLLATHPPTRERIGAAVAFAAARGEPRQGAVAAGAARLP